MSTMKKLAALAAAAVLATGVFAGTTSAADAAPRSPGNTGGVTTYMWDTGWG
ncbi:hypothetical protein [Marmoricola sp. RAF53]|uniref:hypothetical protein n=1 Tax=Marmoricola sp. RAF53 TaxID=3233059 RepID=UPI003F9923D4